jgi:hypothetical protein
MDLNAWKNTIHLIYELEPTRFHITQENDDHKEIWLEVSLSKTIRMRYTRLQVESYMPHMRQHKQVQQ